MYKYLLVAILLIAFCLLSLFSCEKNPTENKSKIETGTVTDIDGNTYRTIKIGNQWWMAENLKVTHYRNGDVIPNVTNNSEWTSLINGAYCNYANDSSIAATYGRLYNWIAVIDNRNIAPEGWHVPQYEEWQTLVDYLGGSDVAGGKMKEAGTTHWVSPNENATNSSGFSALPGGYRNYDDNGFGTFFDLRYAAYFWSSTFSMNRAWRCGIGFDDSHVNLGTEELRSGFSIRFIRD